MTEIVVNMDEAEAQVDAVMLRVEATKNGYDEAEKALQDEEKRLQTYDSQRRQAVQQAITAVRRGARIYMNTLSLLGVAMDRSTTLLIDAAIITAQTVATLGAINGLTLIGAVQAGLGFALAGSLALQANALRAGQVQQAQELNNVSQLLRVITW